MPSTIYNISGDPHIDSPQFAANPSDRSLLYFNPQAFQRPANGTFTTQRNRNLLYRPGFQNWTGSLFKDFLIGEHQRITFRAEVYNIPNHPNWDVPDTNPNNATFGQVTTKTFERSFQLSLRYAF
jgi:hypothetical protein